MIVIVIGRWRLVIVLPCSPQDAKQGPLKRGCTRGLQSGVRLVLLDTLLQNLLFLTTNCSQQQSHQLCYQVLQAHATQSE